MTIMDCEYYSFDSIVTLNCTQYTQCIFIFFLFSIERKLNKEKQKKDLWDSDDL